MARARTRLGEGSAAAQRLAKPSRASGSEGNSRGLALTVEPDGGFEQGPFPGQGDGARWPPGGRFGRHFRAVLQGDGSQLPPKEEALGLFGEGSHLPPTCFTDTRYPSPAAAGE